MIPPYWEEAKKTLAAADPVMGGIINAYQGETLQGKGDAFHTLARSIVGQQISVKAADAVWAKLSSRIQDLEFREGISRTPEDDLRACGLSRSKVVYLKALADFFHSENIACGYWDGMSDEEVIRHITQVKGIGRWSAEMFLIFHLLRPDVFPIADLGLQKAIMRHYGDNERTQKMQPRSRRVSPELSPAALRHEARAEALKLTTLARQWQPYRSVATWYLWRSLDPLPVEY